MASVPRLVNERRLRQECRRLLEELGIRPPLDVRELCRLVGRRRGRPIHLTPHRFPVPGPFGAWTAGAEADHIYYQAQTSTVHQDHIILHELSHLLAGHEPTPEEALFRRTHYDTAQEYEAEAVATIILEWSAVAARISAGESSSLPAQRISRSLSGERAGWL